MKRKKKDLISLPFEMRVKNGLILLTYKVSVQIASKKRKEKICSSEHNYFLNP